MERLSIDPTLVYHQQIWLIFRLAQSIGNRFIKLVWTKGGRSKAGDEARGHLKPVTKSYLVLTFSFKHEFSLQYFNMYRMMKLRSKMTKLKSTKPKLNRRSEAQ
jgi:hypothetical protein